MKAMNHGKEKLPLEDLIGKLKTEDLKYSNLSKAFLYIYVILMAFYAVITVLLYLLEKEVYQLYSGICYMVAFAIFALLFRKYYNEYRSVDYALPTIRMLKQAAYRYKPFQLRLLWLVVALLIMDAGFTFTMIDHASLWVTQVIILGTFFLAFVIGIIYWWIKYKPIYDNVLHLIAEIEN